MTLRVIQYIRELILPLSEDEPPLSTELARELEDLRKVSLNLLMAFLTIHAISASHVLGTITLTLLLYTINLHIAVNTRFLQSSAAVIKFLHAIPLLGIFSMVVSKVIILVRSPAVAACVILACALPPLLIVVRFAKRCAEANLMPFPVQMPQDTAPPGDTTTLPT